MSAACKAVRRSTNRAAVPAQSTLCSRRNHRHHKLADKARAETCRNRAHSLGWGGGEGGRALAAAAEAAAAAAEGTAAMGGRRAAAITASETTGAAGRASESRSAGRTGSASTGPRRHFFAARSSPPLSPWRSPQSGSARSFSAGGAGAGSAKCSVCGGRWRRLCAVFRTGSKRRWGAGWMGRS